MNDPSPKSRLPTYILIAVLSLVAVGAAWYFRPAPIESGAGLLVSSAAYSVKFENFGILFMPSTPFGDGLIFYPGAHIPPEAYAWLGAGLAAKGHPVYIARFPLNFAIIAPWRADAIRKAHPEIAHWAIGGHSLGGSMAAAYARDHQSALTALILLAALPPKSIDLSSMGLRTLLISASEDSFIPDKKIAAAERFLPVSLKHVVIQGGNHGQFGEYGMQKGDGKASLEGSRQRAMALDAVIGFLDKVEAGQGGAGAILQNAPPSSPPTSPVELPTP